MQTRRALARGSPTTDAEGIAPQPMYRRVTTQLKRLAWLCVLASVVVLGVVSPARADTIEELEQRLAEASATYTQAMAKVQELEASAAENQERIDAIQSQIPAQKEKSANAIRRLYKLEQNRSGLLDLILSTEDFNDLITMISYMGAVQEANAEEANRLVALKGELESTQKEIEAQRAEAEEQRNVAQEAMEEAQRLRDEAVAEAARKAAEEAARAAAKSAAQQAVAGGDTSALGSAIHDSAPANQPPASQPPANQSPNPNASGTSADRDAFVAEWTQRIDKYLEGSPLAGYGYAFAEAACDYGVDPRWSPAISNTESGKGAACFLPHNAWGWGQVSWPDWDSAIRAHVRGLSEGYGYTISEAAAQKYCPPNAHDWFVATASEMAKI